MSQEKIAPRLFVGLCLLAFVTMFSYAIASSAAQAVFISTQGSQRLPWVWLLVAGASALAVAGMHAASARLDVVQLFVRASWVSVVLLLGCLWLLHHHVPGAAYALYVWKDIYIIVLVELFWTFANIAFGVLTASKTYGIFCAAGSLGAILGSLGMGHVSAKWDTLHSLWGLLPLLLLGAWGCRYLSHGVPIPMPEAATPDRWRVGLQALKQSPYLWLLMLLVATVQVVINLNDYQFNAMVEQSYPDLVTRTRIFGQIYAVINTGSFILQLGTSLVLRQAGLPLTMLSIPLILGSGLFLHAHMARFWTATLCQFIGKCTDYSLFRASKEILYIPLSYTEKTRGKAIVDIFVYRVAKGGVSVFLLTLGGWHLHVTLSWIALGLCVVWLILTSLILSRYKRLRAAQSDFQPLVRPPPPQSAISTRAER